MVSLGVVLEDPAMISLGVVLEDPGQDENTETKSDLAIYHLSSDDSHDLPAAYSLTSPLRNSAAYEAREHAPDHRPRARLSFEAVMAITGVVLLACSLIAGAVLARERVHEQSHVYWGGAWACTVSRIYTPTHTRSLPRLHVPVRDTLRVTNTHQS